MRRRDSARCEPAGSPARRCHDPPGSPQDEREAISAIGLQIAFYYGLAGVAVVVSHRAELFKSVRNFLLIGLWPGLGAAFLLWMFVEAIGANSAVVNVIGLGLLAVGIVPMTLAWRSGSAYFARAAVGADTVEAAVPAGGELR